MHLEPRVHTPAAQPAISPILQHRAAPYWIADVPTVS